MDIFSGLASILGGGLTGLLGSVATGVLEYKTRKLDIELQKEKYANEIALKKVDAEMMTKEWAAKVEVEDSKAFNTSLTSEPAVYHEGKLTKEQNWLMVVLDFLRGVIRPGLTLYLCAITTVIYVKAARLLNGEVILPGMAYDLVTQIINTILYLTTTCVLWWFGTRNKTPK